MSDINRVIVTGRLTRDPELRSTSSGERLCRFTLASHYAVKTADGWAEKANFFDVVAWGRQAETLSRYLKRGERLLVDGELRHSSWEHEGKRHNRVEIVLKRFSFMSSAQVDSEVAAVFSRPEDDIPF
ncbi:MAG: single-stranded DNA-binding protein [candidate division KSB1 bacterium]|nr:single-stranded DNA-binding protein [candidate division KSB1 bacterium]